MAVINSARVTWDCTDLSNNKPEPFQTCLETMSNHLMTACTKQTAEYMACFEFYSCLGLYSNKHHQFYSTDVLFPPYVRDINTVTNWFLSKRVLQCIYIKWLQHLIHCIKLKLIIYSFGIIIQQYWMLYKIHCHPCWWLLSEKFSLLHKRGQTTLLLVLCRSQKPLEMFFIIMKFGYAESHCLNVNRAAILHEGISLKTFQSHLLCLSLTHKQSISCLLFL